MINLYKLDIYLIRDAREFAQKHGKVHSTMRSKYVLSKEEFATATTRYPTAYHDYIKTTIGRQSEVIDGVGLMSIVTATIEHTLPEGVPLLVPTELLSALRGVNNPIYTIYSYGTPTMLHADDLKVSCYTELSQYKTIKRKP
jgi:hypothetical protein